MERNVGEQQKEVTLDRCDEVEKLRELMRLKDKNKSTYVDLEGKRNAMNWFNSDEKRCATRYNTLDVIRDPHGENKGEK